MKNGLTAVSALALATLCGCASKPAEYHETKVASLISAIPLVQGQDDTVSNSGPMTLKVGDSYTQASLLHLRSCNPDRTECKQGIGKLSSKVTLVALTETRATVLLDLRLDIGKKQSMGNKAMYTGFEIPDGVALLSDEYKKSESYSVDYNRIGRVDLPYGAAFKLCIEAPIAVQNTSVGGCQGQELKLSR